MSKTGLRHVGVSLCVVELFRNKNDCPKSEPEVYGDHSGPILDDFGVITEQYRLNNNYVINLIQILHSYLQIGALRVLSMGTPEVIVTYDFNGFSKI